MRWLRVDLDLNVDVSVLEGCENNVRVVGYVYIWVDLGCLKVNCFF